MTSTSGFAQPGGVRLLPLLLSANEHVNVTALDPNAEDHNITYTENLSFSVFYSHAHNSFKAYFFSKISSFQI